MGFYWKFTESFKNIQYFLAGLEGFIVSYSPWAVFGGSILEQVVTPIPSSLVVLGASFFMMKGVALSMGSLETMFLNISIPAVL